MATRLRGALRGKEAQNRGCVCMCVADTFCRTAETNNTVKQLDANRNLKPRKLVFYYFKMFYRKKTYHAFKNIQNYK